MLDGVSLDQLRTFIAAADEGSFSAAGRRLRRAQSVVSHTLANLEGQLDVKLFDRSARPPLLTDQGRALLADARAVAGDMDLLKARARRIAGGLEPQLNAVADVMFPMAPITGAVATFREKFPSTGLSLYIEGRRAAIQQVLDRLSAIGIVASLSLAPPLLTCERLLTVRMAMVASPRHPLAIHGAPIPTAVLSEHIQLVHTDRSDLAPPGREFVHLSPRTWLLPHLGAKLAFLRAGFGFGFMPLHVVEADLASGELVQITAEETPPEGQIITMSAIHRTDSPPGPAGRWFIDRLKQEDAQQLKQKAGRPPYKSKVSQRLTAATAQSERFVFVAPNARGNLNEPA